MNNIYVAIEEGNINYLKKFPKIGEKVAKQIILDLKGKLNMSKEIETVSEDKKAEAISKWSERISDFVINYHLQSVFPLFLPKASL